MPGDALQGNWRITVKGTVGKEKIKWTSEPRLYEGRPLPNSGRGGRYKGEDDVFLDNLR